MPKSRPSAPLPRAVVGINGLLTSSSNVGTVQNIVFQKGHGRKGLGFRYSKE